MLLLDLLLMLLNGATILLISLATLIAFIALLVEY